MMFLIKKCCFKGQDIIQNYIKLGTFPTISTLVMHFSIRNLSLGNMAATTKYLDDLGLKPRSPLSSRYMWIEFMISYKKFHHRKFEPLQNHTQEYHFKPPYLDLSCLCLLEDSSDYDMRLFPNVPSPPLLSPCPAVFV